jgi:hypothetical protein
MDDQILSLQVGAFAIVVKRRTLLYTLLVVLVGTATYYMANKEIFRTDHNHFSAFFK